LVSIIFTILPRDKINDIFFNVGIQIEEENYDAAELEFDYVFFFYIFFLSKILNQKRITIEKILLPRKFLLIIG